VVICLQQGANCLHMVQLIPLRPKTPSSLASFKSRLVLPFWYKLTQAVLEKRPLNRCSSSRGGLVAKWLACWTQAQYGLGSNRSVDAGKLFMPIVALFTKQQN